jgi:hypothetical protein
MTKLAARIFQSGKDSSKKKVDAPMPKMGTSKAAGVTSAAGCFDKSQAQAV